jgi:hypothetical protein
MQRRKSNHSYAQHYNTMNPLERTRIEKAAYAYGWENKHESTSERIILLFASIGHYPSIAETAQSGAQRSSNPYTHV